MSKRRILKKEISYTAGDLFTEVLIYAQCMPNVDQEKVDPLLTRILEMSDKFVLRAGHPDGKDNHKIIRAFYQKLRADFNNEVDAIAAEISSLFKAEQ
jgi:hypothetical protein